MVVSPLPESPISCWPRRIKTASLSALVIVSTALALVGWAMGGARDARATSCTVASPSDVTGYAEGASVIVVARVTEVTDRYVAVEPEAYLKGPVSAEPIRLVVDGPVVYDDCAQARFAVGERVALFLDTHRWPGPNLVYRLAGGRVSNLDYEASEQDFIAAVRGVTGQYSVPARDGSDSAGIDWTATVLPIGAVSVGVFIIGLFLMRIWHRIDPS